MTDRSARNSTGQERRHYAAQFELRAKPDGTGGTRYDLSGYASVYERGYPVWDAYGEFNETVRAGAGKKTLSENPDVVLVFNHDGMPMARTKAGNLHLSDDSTGLHMDARNLNPEISTVRDTIAGIDEGILDEMSFKFSVTRQDWNDDYTDRSIAEYNINRGDVSVVTFGANPFTAGHLALRAEQLTRAIEHLEGDALVEAMRRMAHRAQTVALPDDVKAMLAQVLGSIAAVDDIVDELQEDIAEAIGVPNPDDDDMQENDGWRDDLERRRLQRRLALRKTA